MKLSCDVIQDLLPLYHDGVCSQESKRIVEEHIATCAACKDVLHGLKEELAPDSMDAAEPLVSIQMKWNEQKKKVLIRSVSIALSVTMLLLIGWWALYNWDCVTIKQDDFVILKLAQLSDGHIQVRMTERYYNTSPEMVYVPEENALYEWRRHPVFAEEREMPSESAIPYYEGGWGEMIFSPEGNMWLSEVDGEILPIKAYYIGKPGSEDAVLIWKEGMELPPADEETEQDWEERRRRMLTEAEFEQEKKELEEKLEDLENQYQATVAKGIK